MAGARQRGASLPGGRDRLFSGCSLSGGIQLANVSLAEFDVDKIREQYVGRGGQRSDVEIELSIQNDREGVAAPASGTVLLPARG